MIIGKVSRLLILGGTADGRQLAEALCALPGYGFDGSADQSVAITYSVAGLVRLPQLPCDVVSGGFSQFGGLRAYIRDHEIDVVLDMTHPYALRMSGAANEATAACGIACWRFNRSAWQPVAADDWHECEDWQTILTRLEDKSSILLSAGQLPSEALSELQSRYGNSGKFWVLRTAVEPVQALPTDMHWIKAIGPFTENDEFALMQQYGIDALVSKNSGGNSTSAKLDVARKLGIPVYMLTRPPVLPADLLFTDLERCKRHVREHFHNAAASALDDIAGRRCRP